MAEGGVIECYTWVVKHVKQVYEDKLSIRSPVFSTTKHVKSTWRVLMSTKTKENIPGCREKTTEKQYISLYLQNCEKLLSLVKATFSIINPLEGKVLSRSTTIFNTEKNDHGGIQDYISLMKLEKLNLEDLIIKCEIDEIKTDFEKFKSLLNNKMYSDIELLIGDEKYPAHKLVLAVSSRVFRENFNQQDSMSEIKVDDMNPKVIYELLRFMYTGTVEYMDEITCQLFIMAHNYEINHLSRMCLDLLDANLNNANVIPNLLAGLKNSSYCSESILQDVFSEFIVKNIENIIKLGICTELVRKAPEFISDILVRVSISRKENGFKKNESWQISKYLYLNGKAQSQKQYESFFNDKIFSDVEIHVGNEKYLANKIVLAVRSPVFKSMFSHNMMEAVSGMVEVEDVEPEVFYQMLRFIYTNEVEDNAKTDDLMQQLLIVADRYEISDLRRECEIILAKNITADNVFNTLKFSDKFSAEGLKNECLEYILDNFCLGQLKQNSSIWNEYALNKALAASHPHLLLDLLTMITGKLKTDEMAEEEIAEFTWVVKNVKRVYEDKLSMRSPAFATTEIIPGSLYHDFKWRLLISTKTQENMPGCYEVTKEKQDIVLYLQNVNEVFLGDLLKVTFSIIKPIEGKVLSKSTTIFNALKNDHGGIQDFISVLKLEKLNLEDLVIKCEIQAMQRGFKKFKPLLNNKMYSDIELLVGDKKYPAHKLVLALSSEVFREHFYGQDSLSEIKIDVVDPKVLYELLRFMYTGKVEYMDEITCQLFNIAVKYEMLDIDKQLIINVLKANLNVQNVIPNFLCFQENANKRYTPRDIFSVFIVKNIQKMVKLGMCAELVRKAPKFLSDILVRVSISHKKIGYKKDEGWQMSKNFYLNDKVQSQKQYESFLKDKTFSDVEIHVGDQKYSAHKIVLAVRSPVFKSMFSHNMMEAVSGMVKVEYVEPEVFYQMLRFIYTNEVEDNAKTDDLIQQLLIVADRYDISDLRRECEIILAKNITVDNVFNILKFADKFSAEGLKNQCLEYILDHFCLGQLKQNALSESLNKALVPSHPHLLLDLLTMITVNYEPL